MAGIHDLTVRDLRRAGIPAEAFDPGVLLLGGEGKPVLLVAALPAFLSRHDAAAVFEVVTDDTPDGFLTLGPKEQVLVFERRPWRRLRNVVDPDDPDAIRDLWSGPRHRQAVSPNASRRLLVLSLPDAAAPASSLWLSVADGEALRPVGFLGNETRATLLEADFRDAGGAPVAGRLVLSAHDIRAGGEPAWSVLLNVATEAAS